MDSELLAIKVEKERRRRGLTQEQLAQSVGVSRRSVWRIERGEGNHMSFGVVNDILEVLGMRIDVLLDDSAIIDFEAGYAKPCYVVDEWEDLHGAETGSVELPVGVYWQGAGPTTSFDVADDAQCARCYRALLSDGTRRQIATSVNPSRLVELWPKLRLPARVRNAWLRKFRAELTGEAAHA